MNRTVQTVVIALVTGGFISYCAAPPLALALRSEELKGAIVDCERAKAERKRLLEISTGDELTGRQLARTANVQLLACLDMDILELKLRSIGVPEHRVRLVELEAIRDRLPGNAYGNRVFD